MSESDDPTSTQSAPLADGPVRPGVREAGSSVRWKLVGSVTERLVNLVSVVLLMHLVDRAEWGLVALAVPIYTLVGMLRDIGVTQAIIQSPKATADFISTCFWLRFVVGVALYLILALIAWPAALLLHAPRLFGILLLLGAVLVVDTVPSVQQAILIRELRVAPAMLVRSVSLMLGVAVAVALAIAGAGAWALVVNAVVATVSSGVLFLFLTQWRPTLRFDRNELPRMVRWGGNLTGTQFLGWFTEHFSIFTMGVFHAVAIAFGWVQPGMPKPRGIPGYPDIILGYYSRAYVMGKWPDSLLGSIVGGGLATSFFAKIQDAPDLMRDALHRATRLMYLAASPVSVVILVVTDDFVKVVGGPTWEGAVLPCRIIAVGGTCLMLRQTLRHWLIAAGHPSILLRNQVIVAAVSVAMTLVAVWFGMVWVALAASLACATEFVLLWTMSRHLTRTGLAQWFQMYWQPLACAVFMGAAMLLVHSQIHHWSLIWPRLLINLLAGVGVWLATARWLCPHDLTLLVRLAIPSRRR